MNIAIVTSEVTYIPQNYNALMAELLKLDSVKLFINLNNRSPSLALKGLGLMTFGARNIGLQLIKNTFKPQTDLRRKWCQENFVHFTSLNTMNNPQATEVIKRHKIDIILNLRTRCIYKEEILNAAKLGCINLHHGILPDYRGTMCDLYALYEDRGAGFSLHKMEKKIDDGVIYNTTEVSTNEKDYWKYLSHSHKKEFEKIKELVQTIEQTGHLPKGLPNQRNHKTVYTKNPTKEMIKKMISKGMIL